MMCSGVFMFVKTYGSAVSAVSKHLCLAFIFQFFDKGNLTFICSNNLFTTIYHVVPKLELYVVFNEGSHFIN